ncbi:Alpha-glucan water dikinase, chloroplastic [Coccomyxa sp. Obi]|nr:Alpha-glucan water dikinase, chloroplastic [Coccomyxa sp. Obi]
MIINANSRYCTHYAHHDGTASHIPQKFHLSQAISCWQRGLLASSSKPRPDGSKLRAGRSHLCRGRSSIRCTAAAQLVDRAPAAAQSKQVLSSQKYDAGVEIEVSKTSSSYDVVVRADPVRPMMLHWAVNEWQLPPNASWPPGTNQIDEKAVQTRFSDSGVVHISFPADKCPGRVVFVLKETQPENWLNSGAGDFVAQLKPPDLSDIVEKVVDMEANASHWSLFNRFCMANDVLDAADAAGARGMALIYVWLRLSTMKQLDWHRGSSYQSKDIAHAQKTIAQRMADKARAGADPLGRQFARMALAGLPRGGGDGDAIRLGILNVMRENGIREGHRPGIEDHFLEQWHQKLHTNTTPADITICESYIDFLHSGDGGQFWHSLWERGGLTREALASMDHPITATPMHLPHLIGPMQHYLWILKTTHSGADLDTSLEMAKGSLDGGLQWTLYDILNNRNEWWVPGKIVEAREQVQWVWKAPCSRDVLLLDIALDNYLRTLLERQDKGSLGGDDLCELIALSLRNAIIAIDSEDLRQCRELWEGVKGGERWSKAWAMRAHAAAQRLELSLGAYADSLYSLTQPLAERFGAACGIDPAYITNFGEEVVRGQPIFVLSQLLKFLEPMLRTAADMAPWQVVSQAEASGRVLVLPDLAEVQGKRFDEATVIIASHVGGMEDIPENVTAVLTASTTDVLSHVAIRARSQKVLLATCFDEAALEELRAMADQTVSLTTDPSGSIAASPLDPAAGALSANGSSAAAALPPLAVPKPKETSKWALQEADFGPGLVGGKSANLAKLRGKVADGVAVPASVALPFGAFERTLQDPSNAAYADTIQGLQKDLEKADHGIPSALAQLRQLVATSLTAPAALVEEAAAAAEAAGLVEAGQWTPESAAWSDAWSAICQVWASKWSERAWLSRRARGVKEGDLYMAVLLQQVVPAEYAFVLHTANPVTGKLGEVFGEVVVGMGEALVGNHPGRALSFRAGPGQQPEVLSLPSKRLGFFAPAGGALIARSDSNGEDLEAFAGAGLYDSVPLPPLRESTVDYASSGLFWEGEGLQSMLQELTQVGRSIEVAFDGAPQDIEGVWVDGKITVVQSRAQVL